MKNICIYENEKSEPIRKSGTKYKYLLNVDGVVSSWRLVTLLMSGSVLLLQNSTDWEALYVYLTPWKDFVPVKADLSDLVDNIDWLESHPDEARKIATEAATLFAERGRPEELYCLTLRSLVSLSGRPVSPKNFDCRKIHCLHSQPA